MVRRDRFAHSAFYAQTLKTFSKTTCAARWSVACCCDGADAGAGSASGLSPCCSEDAEKSRSRNSTVNPPIKTASMNIALGVLVLLGSFVAGTEPRDGSHVRTTEKQLRTVIDEGRARSAFFRSLVARLDGSDVIVYVEPECPMSSRMFGRLTLLGAGGDRRYVNVRISCMLTLPQQIAALGHELRHAVEIADAPSVVDDASLAAEYRRVGYSSRALPSGGGFESRAAIEAARQVWSDLAHTAE